MITPDPETFWTLLHDSAHWEFEIFLMTIFDGVIGYLGFRLFWPFIKRHWNHHVDRDKREGVDAPKHRGITAQVLASYGICEEDVVSWTLTNSELTVVLRAK